MARILIVDDNLDAARPLVRLVERLGYDVECAASGPAALSAIRTSPPDLVILDVMMPQMDGLEVLSRIKGDDATARVAVVMFSAVHDTAAMRLARRRGAMDYWLKGAFEFSELGPRIAGLLATSSGWIPGHSHHPRDGSR